MTIYLYFAFVGFIVALGVAISVFALRCVGSDTPPLAPPPFPDRGRQLDSGQA